MNNYMLDLKGSLYVITRIAFIRRRSTTVEMAVKMR